MELNNTALLEEVRRMEERVRAARREQCSGPGCRESRLGMKFGRGERVLDTVSGLEGLIVAGETRSILIQPAKR